MDWLRELPAQTAQQVLGELDLAWQRCYAGLSRPPRFKRKGQPVTLRFPQDIEVRRLNRRWGSVRVPKLGQVRFRWTRDLPGTVKHASLSYVAGGWHVAFCLEVEVKPAAPNEMPPIGVDRGVAIALMTSEGAAFDRALWTVGEKARLLGLERLKARQVKDSARYCRTCEKIARLHHRATNRRQDFAHKVSTQLAKNHGLVALEALIIPNMTKSASGTLAQPGSRVAQKSGLNRAILDKGWGLVASQLRYKADRYGSQLVEVPPQNTSLACSVCGCIDRANRQMQAVFVCVECGHTDHADVNAALNIRERGIRLALAGGQPVPGRRESRRLRTWRQPSPVAA